MRSVPLQASIATAGREPKQKVQQTMSLEALPKHDRSCIVQAGATANGLAQINAQNLDIHQMLISKPMPANIAADGREESSSQQKNLDIGKDCLKLFCLPISLFRI